MDFVISYVLFAVMSGLVFLSCGNERPKPPQNDAGVSSVTNAPSQEAPVVAPAPQPAPAEPGVFYACKTHPNMTSANPIECPKCGVTMERTTN